MGIKERKPVKTVRAVDRALLLLETLASCEGMVGLQELAEKAGINISTAYRLLGTMLEHRFVQKDEDTGRYMLGLKAFELGNTAICGVDLRKTARPHMEELVRKCNETANLVMLDGLQVIYIYQVESSNMVKMFARVGNRLPAYCTATGKTLLSQFPDQEIDKIFSNHDIKQYTSNTVKNVDELKTALANIREQGYSLDLEEREEGVRCVAAPIRNHEGKVIIALGVSGPGARLTLKYINETLIDLVCESAHRISTELGYIETYF